MASRADIPSSLIPPVGPPLPPPRTPSVASTDGSTPPQEGAKLYPIGEATESQERGAVAEGETANRLFPGELRDVFYMSQATKDALGIPGAVPSSLADTAYPGDRVLIAIRAPTHYGKLEPGHLREKMHNRPTLEVVKDAKGEPVYATHDLIFATVSRDEYLGRQRRHNERSAEFTGGLIEGRVESGEAEGGVLQNFRGEDGNYLQRKRQETHAQFNAGMKTNWPKNMTIEDIEKHVGAEDTLRLERKWARNGRSERPGEYDEYEAKQREREKRAKPSRSVSYPGAPTKAGK